MVKNKTINRDNGGRRSNIERRNFAYSGYIPERRITADRRSGEDRRSGLDRRTNESIDIEFIEMRSGIERRKNFTPLKENIIC